MSAVFDDFGVCFEYPENWQLGEPEHGLGHLTLSVTSPGTAFWTLSIYAADANLADLLAEAVATMRTEYRDLDVCDAEPLAQQWGVVGGPIDEGMVGYDLNFYCLDLTSSAYLRGFKTTSATYLLFFQSADLELDEVVPVFGAMTATLVRDQVQRGALREKC